LQEEQTSPKTSSGDLQIESINMEEMFLDKKNTPEELAMTESTSNECR